jgi:hypothetical protein
MAGARGVVLRARAPIGPPVEVRPAPGEARVQSPESGAGIAGGYPGPTGIGGRSGDGPES